MYQHWREAQLHHQMGGGVRTAVVSEVGYGSVLYNHVAWLEGYVLGGHGV